MQNNTLDVNKPENPASAGSGKTKHNGQNMLIHDDEIRERFGDKADAILAALDGDRATQTNIAMWKGKRFRPAVDVWLEANPQDGAVTANDQS